MNPLAFSKNFWCFAIRGDSRSDTVEVIAAISRNHRHLWLHLGSKFCSSSCPWLVCPYHKLFRYQVTWTVYSFSLKGLFSSSIVLYAFGRVVGQQWAPMLFCVGNAILQGIFCLGACSCSFNQAKFHLYSQVWSIKWILSSYPGLSALVCLVPVDLEHLVDVLVIVQTIAISIGTYLMTGAAGAVSFATSLAVLKPKTWGEGGRCVHCI